jgi:hypothetical protein
VILATQEAEIRRIKVQSQPGQIVHKTLFRKTLHKNRAGSVAQGEGPELMPQYRVKKKKKEARLPKFKYLLMIVKLSQLFNLSVPKCSYL